MATYYIDLYNGNDANNGTSWATAWKTISAGATAARIAAGDEIRISKTPDPVSIGNATWTYNSNFITIPAGLTATVEHCNTAWTAATNVTTGLSGGKLGNCISITPASAFATGKMAYKTLPSSLDLSLFQELSFWARFSTTVAAGTYKLCLCSDLLGDVIVDEFVINTVQYGSAYRPFSLARLGGGNLGAAVLSIAVYAIIDPGTVVMSLDNIIVTKTNGINLTSLVTKDQSFVSSQSTKGLHPVLAIDGTTVYLSVNYEISYSASLGSYFGDSETIETFVVRGFETPQVSSSGTAVNDIKKTGTIINKIKFKGGYQIGTDNQNGHTLFNGICLQGIGLNLGSTINFVEIENMSFVNYYYGIYIGTSANSINDVILRRIYSLSGNYYGAYIYGPLTYIEDIGSIIATRYYGLMIVSNAGEGGSGILIDYIKVIANSSTSLLLYLYGSLNKIKYIDRLHYPSPGNPAILIGQSSTVTDSNIIEYINKVSNSQIGIQTGGPCTGNDVVVNEMETSTTDNIQNNHGGILTVTILSTTYIIKAKCNCGVLNIKTNAQVTVSNSFYYDAGPDTCINILGTNSFKSYKDRVLTERVSDIVPEGHRYSWKNLFDPYHRGKKFYGKIAEVAVLQNKQVTITAKMLHKGFTPNVSIGSVGICVKRDVFNGIENEINASLANMEVWEDVVLQFTPSKDMVIPIFQTVDIIKTATTSLTTYIANLEITQED